MSALPNDAPVFRRMRRDDLDRVCEIENRVYAFPWTRGNFVDSLNASYLCTVLECEAALAGFQPAQRSLVDARTLGDVIQAQPPSLPLETQGHDEASERHEVPQGGFLPRRRDPAGGAPLLGQSGTVGGFRGP